MPQTNSYHEYRVRLGDAEFLFFNEEATFANRLENIAIKHASLHSHEYCELFYVLKGENVVHTEDGQITFSSGDCVLVAAKSVHKVTCAPDTQRVEFSLYLKKGKQSEKASEYAIFCEMLQQPIRVFRNFAGGEAFKRLVRYFCGTYSDKERLIATCLQEILLLMKAAVSHENVCSAEPTMTDSDYYRNYVIEHYFQTCLSTATLTELAGQLYLSCPQTARLVRRLYGHSFVHHVMEQRTQQAAALLNNTDLSVAQIAAHVGYRKGSAFYSAFKAAHGVTPRQYRQVCRGEGRQGNTKREGRVAK